MSREQRRPGKTPYAGRRRPTTRTAGFSSHPDATGGEVRRREVSAFDSDAPFTIEIDFTVADGPPGKRLGIGGWFSAQPGTAAELVLLGDEPLPSRLVLGEPIGPDWTKFGTQWTSDGRGALTYRLTLRVGRGAAAFWGLHAGQIAHPYYTPEGCGIDEAHHAALMKNMWSFAPEGNFVDAEDDAGAIEGPHVVAGAPSPASLLLATKSCNRCARYLPVNLGNERATLSFSNHCVAPHRRPCSHGGFGRLTDIDSREIVQLEYGFQLECRFCKKFEVNAAHNKQRTAAQHKEDGARRRAFELLLTEILGGSPNLRYREQHGGRELADDVFSRFQGRCFKCRIALDDARSMHLDHTRPLALLWPLDETATCLCATCNSAKRDRAPSDFYTPDEIQRLASLVGLSSSELSDPSPNEQAISLLLARLDWFFEDFLERKDLAEVRDGKTAADLLVKALQKVLNRAGNAIDLAEQRALHGKKRTGADG